MPTYLPSMQVAPGGPSTNFEPRPHSNIICRLEKESLICNYSHTHDHLAGLLVFDFLDVRPVIVKSHVSHQQYFSSLDISGKGAINQLANGCFSRPISKIAFGGILSLEDKTVFALVQARATVSSIWHL